jgi:NDP-sugar pyrophosphorylase family protein
VKALLLVGGKGTRLHPVTYKLPKPMAPMVNRPFLEHVVDWLGGHGIDDVVLTTHYLPEAITGYFGDGSRHGIRLTCLREEEPLGTGGAIKNAEYLLDDTFLVLNGDILTDLDLGALISYHHSKRAQATIALTWVEDPTPFGAVETAPDGRIERFREKPRPEEVTTNYINAGVYVFEPALFREMPSGAFSVERDLYPRLVEQGLPLFGFRTDGYWLDIGTVEKYLTAHQDILDGKVAARLPGREVAPGVWVDRSAQIDPEAVLEPPLVIGARSQVARGALVGAYSVLGDGARVGRGATVESSVVWPGSSVAPEAELTGCVVADQYLARADQAPAPPASPSSARGGLAPAGARR